MFERLVDITEPICREIDSKKSDYLIFDTTGIEPFVAENNPKFFNTKLQTAKKLSKSNSNYNPYLAVYGLLPDTAASNANIKQQYINGHYCYAYKAGILTNGLGIVRNIAFFDNDFKEQHPEIVSRKIAGITQLIGVILAKELQKPKLYKSVRKLISAL